MESARLGWLLATVACVAAVTSLVVFGILGIGRIGSSAFADVRYFYVAGDMLRAGLSPYPHEAFKTFAAQSGLASDLVAYAYPPHSLTLWLPLTWLSFDGARWFVTVMNSFLIVAIAALMGRALLTRAHRNKVGYQDPWLAAFVAAIVIGNPFTTHVMWTGQNGFFILACLLIAMHSLESGRYVVAGVCLGLASVKPQLSVLVIVWALFAGHFRAMGVMALTILAMMLAPLKVLGPGVLMDWLRSLQAYQLDAMTALPYMTTLKSFLAGTLPTLPSGAFYLLPLIGLATAIALARVPSLRSSERDDVLSLLLLASLAFIQGRDYEIAVLAPVVPVLWWHCRGNRTAQGAALLILILLYIPQRLVSQWDISILHVGRAGLLTVTGGWLLLLILRSNLREKAAGLPCALSAQPTLSGKQVTY
jgi:hypothetical protein